MNNSWITYGNVFRLKEISQQFKALPKGVYNVCEDDQTKEIYLTHIQEQFEFPYKVYGVEQYFIERVIKSYHHTSGNLGVLMNGVKGTGKSVTAELICNKIGLPVLVISKPFKGIPEFLNGLQEDVAVFFDEYEKVYRDYDNSILTVMDGVLNTKYRKLFLLTTNDLYVSNNLLQRPGRIRYVKTFSDLSLNVITELIDDLLLLKEFREPLISYLSSLETITIDIVKAVTQEVNIHGESPEVFKDVFNTKTVNNKFNVYKIENGIKSEPIHLSVDISPWPLDKITIGADFRIQSFDVGEIVTIHGENMFTVKMDDDNAEPPYQTFYLEKIEHRHSAFLGTHILF